MPSTRRRARPALLALAVLVTGIVVATSGPAQADDPGQITGTVTGPGGVPVQGAQLTSYRLNGGSWQVYGLTDSAANGTYTLGFLTPGTYRVGVDPRPQGFQVEYWQDAATLQTATDIVITGSETAPADIQLADAASIAGTVTDTLGAPIAGAGARAYARDGQGVEQTRPWWEATSAADGTYEIDGLEAGEHRVDVYASGYLPGSTAAVLTASTQATGRDVVLTRESRLAGRVTNPGGVGLNGVQVVAYRRVEGELVQVTGTSTNGTGHYEVGGLPAGTYVLGFEQLSGDHVSAFLGEFGPVDDEGDAREIPVAAEATVNGLDVPLTPKATIAGFVSDAATGAPAQATVTAYRLIDGEWQAVASGGTGIFGGSYSLKVFAPHHYRIGVVGTDAYHPEFWSDSATVRGAGDFPVPGGTVPLDFALTPKGAIAGTITKPGGAPYVGVCAQAWHVVPEADRWERAGVGCAGSDGTYKITGLDADTYKVRFTGSGSASEWWADQATRRAATEVVVGHTGTVSGISPVVGTSLGSVSGVVTDHTGAPLAGATALLSRMGENGGITTFIPGKITGADGSYSYSGLDAGEYFISFGKVGYATVYYPQTDPAGLSFADLPKFDLGEGEVRDDIDAQISAAGQITGRVVDETEAPVDALVTPFRFVDGMWKAQEPVGSSADFGGTYDAFQLPPGDYRLRFSSNTKAFRTEWWPDAATLADATTIHLDPGQTVTDRDVEVAPPYLGDINGRVRNPEGDGLAQVIVEAYRQKVPGGDWSYVDAVYSNGTGDFGLDLPEGTYRLRFVPGDPYAPEWYEDAPDVEAAQDVVLGATPVSGVDAQLDRHGRIRGLVEAAGSPLGGVEVEVHRLLEGEWQEVASDRTNSAGVYSVGRLAPDTYRVYFGPAGTYAGEWHADALTLADAAGVVVASGPATVLDASLVAGGRVAGTVTGVASPVGDAQVDLYRQVGVDFEIYRSTDTDPQGDYGFGRLPVGVYRVHVVDPDRDWAPRWAGGSATPAGATNLSVAVGQVVDADVPLLAASHVTGTVTVGAGSGLAGARVAAYRLVDGAWERERSVRTGSTGTYDLDGLPAGTYRVEALDTEDEFDNAWWDDASTLLSATDVLVPAAGTVSAVDVHLGPQPAVTNQVLPSVTGTAAVGGTLTAAPGTWTPGGAAFAYQWLVDGVPITGATGSTYVPVADDAGSMISVRVTATLAGHSAGVETSIAVGPVAATLPPLQNTVLPTFAGTAQVGETIAVIAGTWSPTGATFTYQWLSNGSPISGATGASYAIPADQAGRNISVRVTARKTGYTAASATSAARKVGAGVIDNNAKPKIAGKARVGQKLTAKVGSWDPGGLSFSYKWFANDKAISGANKPTFTLTKAQKGKRISVRVTASKAGYTTKQVTSPETKAVLAAN